LAPYSKTTTAVSEAKTDVLPDFNEAVGRCVFQLDFSIKI